MRLVQPSMNPGGPVTSCFRLQNVVGGGDTADMSIGLRESNSMMK